MIAVWLLNFYYRTYAMPYPVGRALRYLLTLLKPGIANIGTEVERNAQIAKSLLKQLPKISSEYPNIKNLYERCYDFELEPVLGVAIHRLRNYLSLQEIDAFIEQTYAKDVDSGVCMSMTTLNRYVLTLYHCETTVDGIDKSLATKHLVNTLAAQAKSLWPQVNLGSVRQAMGLDK